MTIDIDRSPARTAAPVAGSDFGGAHTPYDRALRAGSGLLGLADAHAETGGTSLDIGRFCAPATPVERELLAGLRGPLIDVGCGPGRIVHAAIQQGKLALGVDVSRTAVGIAREKGLPVLLRSVFQPLPAEGHWSNAVLLDGNIGIGGDPTALLARCAQLVRPGGRVLVEAHADGGRRRFFDAVMVGPDGARSEAFPWAEVGIDALRDHAAAAGWAAGRSWARDSRRFAEFRTAR